MLMHRAAQKKSSVFYAKIKIRNTKRVVCLRIFQRFRLVKFIEKFKTRVKNVKIEKLIAFDKYLHELLLRILFSPQ